MSGRIDAVVVGAGVIGLAAARALAMAGKEVLVLEAEAHFGSITSSRNSEVIHAGIYYPPGSLKTRHCIEGRKQLYAYCEARGIPHRKLGKLVFAHDLEQMPELEERAAHARAVGAGAIELLDEKAVKALEPELDCAGAMLSPETGIVDSHALMLALLGEAEAHGAQLVTHCKVERIGKAGGLWTVMLEGQDEATVETPVLVNSAGLAAPRLAHRIEGLRSENIPPSFFAKGCWFAYDGKVPFQRLIYPLPEPGGLGTHLTLDLAGQARFGPDVEWVDGEDYSVDPSRHAKFAEAARRIWPAIDPAKLHPAMAGIRPKIAGPGEPNADFRIDGPETHGCGGLVNLFGIESPGLTASLSIAAEVVAKLRD